MRHAFTERMSIDSEYLGVRNIPILMYTSDGIEMCKAAHAHGLVAAASLSEQGLQGNLQFQANKNKLLF